MKHALMFGQVLNGAVDFRLISIPLNTIHLIENNNPKHTLMGLINVHQVMALRCISDRFLVGYDICGKGIP